MFATCNSDVKLHTLHQVIDWCFVLHNYCENKNENLHDQNLMPGISFEKRTQPSISSFSYRERVNKYNAIFIRNALTLYFEYFLIITGLRHLSR